MDHAPEGNAASARLAAAGAGEGGRQRGLFSSRLGFILAAAGSAVGLGNIWRFPYMAGEKGGGAFVLLYLGCIVLIGVPVMLAELAMGRASRRNPVGAFRALVPQRWWPAVGGLGVVTGFCILAFYSVIAGWTVGYAGKAIAGHFQQGLTVEQSRAEFAGLIGSPAWAVGLTALFILLTVLIVRGGVRGGIERGSKIMMPIFLLLLVVLAVRSMTLPGGLQGVAFLFEPDFSKINASVVMSALGQAFFSLSLGMGAMITYGSYLREHENMPFAAASVALSDTLVAVLAGLTIFPALFSAGVAPNGGPGLVFVILPTIFDTLPAGDLFAIAFYVLLSLAALTSTISLLEVVVAYLVDEKGWTREAACWIVGAGVLVLAVPSALSFGGSAWLSTLLGERGGFLDLQNIIFGNFALTVGALFIALFVGWKWGTTPALEAIEAGGHRLFAKGLWTVLIRYVCPVAVLVVLGFIVATGQFF